MPSSQPHSQGRKKGFDKMLRAYVPTEGSEHPSKRPFSAHMFGPDTSANNKNRFKIKRNSFSKRSFNDNSQTEIGYGNDLEPKYTNKDKENKQRPVSSMSKRYGTPNSFTREQLKAKGLDPYLKTQVKKGQEKIMEQIFEGKNPFRPKNKSKPKTKNSKSKTKIERKNLSVKRNILKPNPKQTAARALKSENNLTQKKNALKVFNMRRGNLINQGTSTPHSLINLKDSCDKNVAVDYEEFGEYEGVFCIKPEGISLRGVKKSGDGTEDGQTEKYVASYLSVNDKAVSAKTSGGNSFKNTLGHDKDTNAETQITVPHDLKELADGRIEESSTVANTKVGKSSLDEISRTSHFQKSKKKPRKPGKNIEAFESDPKSLKDASDAKQRDNEETGVDYIKKILAKQIEIAEAGKEISRSHQDDKSDDRRVHVPPIDEPATDQRPFETPEKAQLNDGEPIPTMVFKTPQNGNPNETAGEENPSPSSRTATYPLAAIPALDSIPPEKIVKAEQPNHSSHIMVLDPLNITMSHSQATEERGLAQGTSIHHITGGRAKIQANNKERKDVPNPADIKLYNNASIRRICFLGRVNPKVKKHSQEDYLSNLYTDTENHGYRSMDKMKVNTTPKYPDMRTILLCYSRAVSRLIRLHFRPASITLMQSQQNKVFGDKVEVDGKPYLLLTVLIAQPTSALTSKKSIKMSDATIRKNPSDSTTPQKLDRWRSQMANLTEKAIEETEIQLELSGRLERLDSNTLGIECLETNQKLIKDEIDTLRLRSQFEEVFDDRKFDNSFLEIPKEEEILGFLTNLMISAKIVKQIMVISFVLLERLLYRTSSDLTPRNWRFAIVSCFTLASKAWDDDSYGIPEFSKILPSYEPQLLNKLEGLCLDLLDFDLSVPLDTYTRYYFYLFSFTNSDKSITPGKTFSELQLLNKQKPLKADDKPSKPPQDHVKPPLASELSPQELKRHHFKHPLASSLILSHLQPVVDFPERTLSPAELHNHL